MLALESLLEENYSSLQDVTVIPYVMNYIDHQETLDDLQPLFAKRLLKVATHIIRYDRDLFSLTQLKKLHQFAIDAVSTTLTASISLEEIQQKSILAGHLYAHQGHLAKELYYQEGKKQHWLKKSHESFKKAKQILTPIATAKNEEFLAWLHYHNGFVLYLQAKQQQNTRLAKKAKQDFLRCKHYQETTSIASLEPLVDKVDQYLQSLKPLLVTKKMKKHPMLYYTTMSSS
jgi:hypothetical protein